MAGVSAAPRPLRRFISMSALMATGLVGVFLPLGGIAPAGAAPVELPAVGVTKTNDAGANTQSGDDVTFTVTVTNPPNNVPVTITGVTDQVGSGAPFDVCNSLLGQTLAAGASASCSFTLADYAPPHGQDNAVTNTIRVQVAAIPGVTRGSGPLFLIADEDMIDNTDPGYLDWNDAPQEFTAADVNDDHPGKPERSPLDFFTNGDAETTADDHIGKTITLPTGQEQDEGLFGLTTIPSSWADAGPTDSGATNFLGNPFAADFNGDNVVDKEDDDPPPHNVGPGLGTGSDPESLLDKIPNVVAFREADLAGLVGQDLCLLVKDSDVSYDKGTHEGNLQGEYLGVVGLHVNALVPAEEGSLLEDLVTGLSSSTLPGLLVEILDPEVCSLPDEENAIGRGQAQSVVSTPPPPTQPLTEVAPVTVAGVVLQNPAPAPAVVPAALELPRTGAAGPREATLLALALLLAGTAVRALGRRRGGLTGS